MFKHFSTVTTALDLSAITATTRGSPGLRQVQILLQQRGRQGTHGGRHGGLGAHGKGSVGYVVVHHHVPEEVLEDGTVPKTHAFHGHGGPWDVDCDLFGKVFPGQSHVKNVVVAPDGHRCPGRWKTVHAYPLIVHLLLKVNGPRRLLCFGSTISFTVLKYLVTKWAASFLSMPHRFAISVAAPSSFPW